MQRLLAELLAQDLSAAWLARRVGVSRGHIHGVIRGRWGMSPSLAARIANALGVPVSDLFGAGAPENGMAHESPSPAAAAVSVHPPATNGRAAHSA